MRIVTHLVDAVHKAIGPAAHLLKQPAAPHKALAFVGPMEDAINRGGPDPAPLNPHWWGFTWLAGGRNLTRERS